MDKIILIYNLYKLYNYSIYIYTGYKIYSYFNSICIKSSIKNNNIDKSYIENITDNWLICYKNNNISKNYEIINNN